MSSSGASEQGHGLTVIVPEPEVLLPLVALVEGNEMSSSETSAQDHGVPVPVPALEVPEAAAGGTGMISLARLARRRARQMLRMTRIFSAEVERDLAKRARPESDVSPDSSEGSSAKVAPPEPQQGAAAAAAVTTMWAPANTLSHGVRSVIGRRQGMEDAVAVAVPLPVPVAAAAVEGKGKEVEEAGEEGDGGWVPEFFAVYDGHGGPRVAETCRVRLHLALAEELARLHLGKGGGDGDEGAARWTEAMLASFARVDGEVCRVQIAENNFQRSEGSTAVVVVVEPRRIVVANCGDSRAVLCRGGVAVPLSTDHKPTRPDELERIESVGGQVLYWNGPRVLGVLATSRSIGDYSLKPSVTAEPEVTVMDRTDMDEFIILGSDGLWDVMSNEFACKVARCCLSGRVAVKYPATVQGSSASDAAALLVEFATARGSEDNISAVVVELRRLMWRKKVAQQNDRT